MTIAEFIVTYETAVQRLNEATKTGSGRWIWSRLYLPYEQACTNRLSVD